MMDSLKGNERSLLVENMMEELERTVPVYHYVVWSVRVFCFILLHPFFDNLKRFLFQKVQSNTLSYGYYLNDSRNYILRVAQCLYMNAELYSYLLRTKKLRKCIILVIQVSVIMLLLNIQTQKT